MKKHKKFVLVGLILSVALLAFGFIACFTFCHGCGIHGIVAMSYACSKPFMKISSSIIITAIGGFFAIVSVILLARINNKKTNVAIL